MWDYAQSGLEKCRRLAASRGVRVTTEWVDVTKAKWPEAHFDVVVCTYLHLPAPQRQAVLSFMASAIKPGGHLVMEVFSLHQVQYGTGGPADPTLLYHPAEFWFSFSSWRIKHWYWGEVERKEGLYHNGTSHVIQCWLQRPED
ncbi:class I SAM-dependent methyltransferase [Polycladomyces zharkentensis]|uniref:class I SAM-dependent methyltransferase n=1 Tax=Polycladomyces zharkentensis TaxID=2807616 RepID=UPI00265FDB87|nr:class I SAM-dependent methyltransferase [Polycladomyces sp. WAk]